MENLNGNSSRQSIQSLERALRILNLFSYDNDQLNFSDIMKATGFAKATTFRIVTTLNDNEYLSYNKETRKYSIGPRLLYLGSVAVRSTKLLKTALLVMEDLRNRTSETITLFIRKENFKVCIGKVESNNALRYSARLGENIPLHVGASGKVLLMGLEYNEFQKFVNEACLYPMTSHTITDIEKLKEAIAEVRKNGYSISCEERQLGAAGIGAPIFNHYGKVIASLDISGPKERFDSKIIPSWIELLKDSAHKISRQMGYFNCIGG